MSSSSLNSSTRVVSETAPDPTVPEHAVANTSAGSVPGTTSQPGATFSATPSLPPLYDQQPRIQLPYQAPSRDIFDEYWREIGSNLKLALARANFNPSRLDFVQDMALHDYMANARLMVTAQAYAADPYRSETDRAEHAMFAAEIEPKVHALLCVWLELVGDHAAPPAYKAVSSPTAATFRPVPAWCPRDNAPAAYEWLRIFEDDPLLPEEVLQRWRAQARGFTLNTEMEQVRLMNEEYLATNAIEQGEAEPEQVAVALEALAAPGSNFEADS